MIMPMIIQLVGAVTNIILDPIMIYGLSASRAMGVVARRPRRWRADPFDGGRPLILAFGKHAVSFSLRGFRFHGKTVRDIYVVGVPSIVMNAIGTVMTMAMNGILAAFSAAAVNVFGVYFKLQSFVVHAGFRPHAGADADHGLQLRRAQQAARHGRDQDGRHHRADYQRGRLRSFSSCSPAS